MKVEQAKQIASNAIEQLKQALERGHSETLKEYLAAIASNRSKSRSAISARRRRCVFGMTAHPH